MKYTVNHSCVPPDFWKAIADATPSWHCNGKIYSGGRVYVSNKEYRFTPTQIAELQAYWSAKAAWCAEMKKLES